LCGGPMTIGVGLYETQGRGLAIEVAPDGGTPPDRWAGDGRERGGRRRIGPCRKRCLRRCPRSPGQGFQKAMRAPTSACTPSRRHAESTVATGDIGEVGVTGVVRRWRGGKWGKVGRPCSSRQGGQEPADVTARLVVGAYGDARVRRGACHGADGGMGNLDGNPGRGVRGGGKDGDSGTSDQKLYQSRLSESRSTWNLQAAKHRVPQPKGGTDGTTRTAICRQPRVSGVSAHRAVHAGVPTGASFRRRRVEASRRTPSCAAACRRRGGPP